MVVCVSKETASPRRCSLVQPGRGHDGPGVAEVKPVQQTARGGVHMGEDDVVEVTAAEALDAVRCTPKPRSRRECGAGRRVEGAAAEVIYGEHLAGLEVPGGW
jgi:hypothetical protein